MKESIFLSVILPVYNAEQYLSQCIESIVAIECEGVEIILVDDGSTDKSPEIIAEYCRRYPNIKKIRQQNSGPSVARNNGLGHSTGKYVCFIDSDDYIDSQVFSHHLRLIGDIEIDVWASDFMRVADNGCVLDRVYQIKEREIPVCDGSYLTAFLEARDCIWNIWRYIFSRDFLDRNDIRFAEGYSIAEDLEFVVRFLSAEPKIAFFHEPYYFYRVNYGASLTRVFSAEKVRQLMEMFSCAMGYLGESENDSLIKAKLAREYVLNLSALYEVEKRDRVAVLDSLESYFELAEYATGAYRYVAKAVNLMGIPVAAWLLYMMKRMKRLLRGIKTNLFNRGQE